MNTEEHTREIEKSFFFFFSLLTYFKGERERVLPIQASISLKSKIDKKIRVTITLKHKHVDSVWPTPVNYHQEEKH